MSNTWTLSDVMRLSHPSGVDRNVGDFILGKGVSPDAPEILKGFSKMQLASSTSEVLKVLNQYKNLPWETVPTQFLKDPEVWKALFYNDQLNGQALVRNVTRMGRIGAFNDLNFMADYAARLKDEKMLERTRLHPVNLLNAHVVYSNGQQDRNGYGLKKDWTTEGVIADALQDAFYKSFKYVEAANKRTLVAIDVSGSMSSKAMGLDLSCAQVSGAVAMTIARTEPKSIIRGFTSGRNGSYWSGESQLTDLGITANTNLSDAMTKVRKSNFGRTDCALPMTWALENKVEVDHFVILTDSETWAGNIKPHQSLKKYRDSMNIDARVTVCGVASNGFTIADNSGNMMDIVGFDSNAPKIIADFGGHRI